MKKQLAAAAALTFVVTSSLAQMKPSSPRESRQPRRSGAMMMHSDSDLQAMARRSLERDEAFSVEARNVNIKVRNGRASLQGFIDSPTEKDALNQKVLDIEGVRSVNNNIMIRE